MGSISDEGHKWLSRLWKRVFTAMLYRQTGASRHQKTQQEPREVHQIWVDDDGAEDEPRSDDDGAEDEPGPPESLWLISIKEKLKQAGQDNKERPWEKLSTYRIPAHLKDGKDNTYAPQVVCLGPYHRDKEHLRQMDRHKWRCLRRMLRRTPNDKIVRYLDSVKEVEETARACYEGTITMTSDEFVEMMVLDGCFAIELFRGFSMGFKEMGYSHNDPVFSLRGSMHMIRRDMIMLENQIPLFILDRLFRLQLGQPDQMGLLAKVALQFFIPLKPTDIPLYCLSLKRLKFDPLPDKGELPCLELFRRSLLSSESKRAVMQASLNNRQQVIHCVTELRKKGIKFKLGQDGFWDIKFEDGTLEIPRLVIHDGTRSLFLNLIAFEQCHLNCGNDVSSYVIFMDNLINSPEDVGHLHECGILEHWLGCYAEVADLFNHLCKEVDFDIINDSYLSEVTMKVNTYSSHRWHRWIASLKLEYFSNPWSSISVIAAFILLVLTFVQAFYAVYSYHKPGS